MDSTLTGRSYGWNQPYRHSWPGMAVQKTSAKHNGARKARFNARHG